VPGNVSRGAVQLTYHTDYALRLLIYLVARPGQTVGTREIAEHYGISPDHLIKVAKSLTRAGWLVSSRGVGGGVRLAERTPSTPIGDIVRHTENTPLVECFHLETNTCPIHRGCHLRSILHQAHQAFFDVLDSFTVSDLAKNPGSLASPLGKKPRRTRS